MPSEFTSLWSAAFCWLAFPHNLIGLFDEFANGLRAAHFFRVELDAKGLFYAGNAFGARQRIKPQIDLQIHFWMNCCSLKRVLFDRFRNRLTSRRFHH